MKSFFTASLILALAACNSSVSGEQVADLTGRIDAAQSLNERLDQARIAAVTAAVQSGAPGESCPEDALLMTSGNRRNLQRVAQAELSATEGKRLFNFRRTSERQRIRLSLTGPDAIEAPPADHRDLAAINPERLDAFSAEVDEMGTTEWWRYDIVVVETQRIEASSTGSQFTPGYLGATAVIFDYATETVVCQAAAEARHEANERVRETSQVNNARQLMVTLEGRLETDALNALGQTVE